MEYLTSHTYWNNTLLEYGQALVTFLIIFIVAKAIAFVAKKKGKKWTERTTNMVDDQIVSFISTFASVVGFFVGLFVAKEMLTLPEQVDQIFRFAVLAGGIVFGALAMQSIVTAVIKQIIGKILLRNQYGVTIAPFIRKLTGAIIWILAALLFLANIGFEIGSILTGLGLGGLAFALAAQDTLGNFFASLAIFLDQPFQVGDMVKIGDVEGTIKEVGIRSTRIESFQGKTQFIIPNSQVANTAIENISKRDDVRFDFTLGLVYSTSQKKLEKAVAIVTEILDKHPGVQGGCWVNFFEFGDFSLNIKVRMNTSVGTENSYAKALQIREEVNFEIMQQFEQEGLEFAFPTQTIVGLSDHV